MFYESSGTSMDVPPNDWQTNLVHSSVLMDPQPHVRKARRQPFLTNTRLPTERIWQIPVALTWSIWRNHRSLNRLQMSPRDIQARHHHGGNFCAPPQFRRLQIVVVGHTTFGRIQPTYFPSIWPRQSIAHQSTSICARGQALEMPTSRAFAERRAAAVGLESGERLAKSRDGVAYPVWADLTRSVNPGKLRLRVV